MKNQSDYLCPVCHLPLTIEWGDGSLHKGDKAFGGFLTCNTPAPKCLPHENVKGHGRGRSEATILENAYNIILSKYTDAKVDFDFTEETEAPAPKLPPVVKIEKKSKPVRVKAGLPVVAIEKDEDAL